MAENMTIGLLRSIGTITEPIYSRLLVSTLLIVIGLILGKLAQKVVLKVLGEIELNRLLKQIIGLSLHLEQMIGLVVKYAIYFAFFFWALERLNIGSLLLNALFFVFIIIVIISIVLGLKDFLPNIISGIMINRKNMLRVGDKIKIGSIAGTVTEVNILNTRIKTSSDDIIFIPNSMMMREKFRKN